MRGAHRISGLMLGAGLLLAACGSGAGTIPPSTPGSVASQTPPSASARPTTAASTPSPSPTPTPRPSAPETPGPIALAWEALPVEGGPAAREDHTWTVDGEGRVAYLFGGRATDAFGDLWAYDLASDRWSPLAPPEPAPPARFGHEAAWVDGVGLVIFAGQAGTTFYNDLWAYQPGPNRWRQLTAAGAVPVARYGSCSAVAPDGRLWMSHGFTSDGVRFADTRVYDFASGTWADATPAGEVPVNRCLHACWWADDGAFVLYAGQTTGITALGDLWRFESAGMPAAGWRRVATETLPPERNLPAVARWAGGTVAFGGQSVNESFLSDAWLLPDDAQPIRLVSSEGGPMPSERAGAALVADPPRGRLLLFGGRNETGALADVWTLSSDGG